MAHKFINIDPNYCVVGRFSIISFLSKFKNFVYVFILLLTKSMKSVICLQFFINNSQHAECANVALEEYLKKIKI